MIKVKKDGFFGGINYVSLNSIRLNLTNIKDFDLIKTWEDEKEEVYKVFEDDSIVIVVDKKKRRVDWYSDTDENGYSYPNEYYERDKDDWIKLFKRDTKIKQLGII